MCEDLTREFQVVLSVTEAKQEWPRATSQRQSSIFVFF